MRHRGLSTLGVIGMIPGLAGCARPTPVPAAATTSPTPATAPATRPAQPDKHLKGRVANEDWKQMAAAVIEGAFIRPADAPIAQPIWGHAKGLQVGLYPMPGLRMLRLYTPYLGYPMGRVINFIAIEPIREGQQGRALSEMEPSDLDAGVPGEHFWAAHDLGPSLNAAYAREGAPGKRFWAADDPADPTPRLPEEHPARGLLSREGNVDILRVYILQERNHNGTHPYVRLTFRSDRPEEVGLALFAHHDSAPMRNCIATATMGNFARLRELHLAGGKIASAKELWPNLKGDSFGEHKQFTLKDIYRTPAGVALAACTNDEANPQEASDPALPGWRYYGKTATQYWRCDQPDPELKVLVNGRCTYWGRKTPLPGGVAFENFEMVAPFKAGQEFWFGVTEKTPKELGIK